MYKIINYEFISTGKWLSCFAFVFEAFKESCCLSVLFYTLSDEHCLEIVSHDGHIVSSFVTSHCSKKQQTI